MAFGTAAFMANYFAFCQEVSRRHTGFVVGVLGGLGNLFVAGFLPFAGFIKDSSGSFGPIFLLAGLLPLVGLSVLAFGWGRDVEAGPAGFPSASED
jgi:ACS family hexuronate transporter-like MFS transporter